MNGKERRRPYGLCVITCLLIFNSAFAQVEDKPVYFERLSDGQTQFYFDDHYFLVDKFCQYKTIERVGKYNVALKAFDGPFTDYNNDGKVILTGNYHDGKREGVFNAYFLNGKVAFSETYKSGQAIDTSVYNYPDGLPMLEIVYRGNEAYVWNFWDTHRRQRVKNGEGKFQFAVKAEGYNEYGYAFIDYSGRIVGGKPDGQWNITYRYPDEQVAYAGYERFERGKFKIGYDEIEGAPYMSPRLQIGPSFYYIQAENMVSKGCTIDENQDFTLFLMKRMEAAFSRYDSSALTTRELAVDVEVGNDGSLKEVKIVKGFEDEGIDKLLLHSLETISYWIPSYKDGEYIEDIFHINVEVYVDGETKQLKFYNLQLERENGI